jgi:hypothetical protein
MSWSPNTPGIFGLQSEKAAPPQSRSSKPCPNRNNKRRTSEQKKSHQTSRLTPLPAHRGTVSRLPSLKISFEEIVFDDDSHSRHLKWPFCVSPAARP